MVIRGETTDKVNISEIETLIIESTAVALTSALIADLTDSGVNIIFCNNKHTPSSFFIPVHSHWSVSKNIKQQIAWTETQKSQCWQQIIQEKIKQQALHLQSINKLDEYNVLLAMSQNVDIGDTLNLEARAAAGYFRTLFGKSFARGNDCFENEALNYGYTLLLSAFVREIAACGYITELGIHHKGVENAFNLASDLMEPFRIVVDRLTLQIPLDQKPVYKRYMLNLFSQYIKINNESQALIPAIRIYLHRIFRFLNGEVDNIYTIEIQSEQK